MRLSRSAAFLLLPAYLACGPFHPTWHDQRLPSGKTIPVTAFNLVWGVEHDDRDPGKDSFALEFVSAFPNENSTAQEQEALEVFELVRPVSELWGFETAYLSGFQQVERKGHYNIFTFTRGTDGRRTLARQAAKVFANE